MKPVHGKATVMVTMVLLTGLLLGPLCSGAPAQSAKELLSELNKDLRSAEKDMFAGQTEKAIAALGPMRELLSRAKAAEPNHPGLVSAEGKLTKLIKDLEKRTGKDLGGGTLTSAAESSKTQLPPKPEAPPMPAAESQKAEPAQPPKTPESARTAPSAPSPARQSAAAKLPHAARKPAEDAKRMLESLDANLDSLADPAYRGDKDQLVARVDGKLKEIRGLLESAKSLSAEKGVASHPDLDQLAASLAGAEKKVADAKAGHQQAQKAAGEKAQEVNNDVKTLLAEYQRVRPVFDRATGSVMHYNDLKPVKDLLDQINAFEKNDAEKLKEELAVFAQKYGSDRDEIDNKAKSMGYSGEGRAGFPYTEIAKGIENVNKTKTVMADDLIKRAADMKSRTSKGIHDFYRIKQYAEIREWGELAAKFDPQNPRVREFNGGIEAWISEDMKALNAKIDAVTWPKQAANAPEDAAQLAKTVSEFLQKESDKLAARDKDSRKVLAVIVAGPWRVFQKNILDEPIQYGLPVVYAVQHESEKAANLARVFELTMLTEEYKGVKTAPPFIGSAVGNSHYIRASAVK